ncbi:MAG: hypothetical protein II943_10845 [Victivallales bacterium]|nr:hypothetical protein [Victivallales bacterium]
MIEPHSLRGKVVAVCDYEASYTASNPPIWNDGYPVWWHLTNSSPQCLHAKALRLEAVE